MLSFLSRLRFLFLFLFVYALTHTTTHAYPNGYVWGCLNISKTLPFCDSRLNTPTRIADLISRLTLDEKLNLLGADTVNTGVGSCTFMDAGVSRLGIPHYLQLVETNSAVASMCFAENVCATEFPAPACLTASFNRSVWHRKGEILSDEMRAFNNLNWMRGTDNGNAYIGLTGFGPNINIVRDPRFGRNSELPSEDPYISGTYAYEYVSGCQFGTDSKYLKMVSGLKHFAAYSVENGRSYRMFNISTFDLFDTYLEQYAIAFGAPNNILNQSSSSTLDVSRYPKDEIDKMRIVPLTQIKKNPLPNAGAMAVMCSYAGINGLPSCSDPWLLNDVLRSKWERNDVMVATDCGAIDNTLHQNHYANSKVDAAAKAMNAGSDLDLGDQYYPTRSVGGNDALKDAISQGNVSMSTIHTALSRVLEKRFRTGQFDPLEHQPYTQIGAEVINSTSNWEFVLESALQGLVLLKNDDVTLPFPLPSSPTQETLALLGPHVYSQRDLFEDYKGDCECYNPCDNSCVRTIANVFQDLYPGTLLVEEGVGLSSFDPSGIPAALNAARNADRIVLCVGIGNEQEHEGKDRVTTVLPGLQESFILEVLSLQKPTVVVLINGGIISLGPILPVVPALIEAFYPAMRTGEALFRSIFGLENRWGKLPVTIYPPEYILEVDMYSFNVTDPPGRTYRYYTGTPEFEFGYGLSYTRFSIQCVLNDQSGGLSLLCDVSNIGDRDGDDVIFVYHRISDDLRHSLNHPAPIRSVVDFTRVHVTTGSRAIVFFEVTDRFFQLTNNNGDHILYSGLHYLDVTDGVTPPIQFPIYLQM